MLIWPEMSIIQYVAMFLKLQLHSPCLKLHQGIYQDTCEALTDDDYEGVILAALTIIKIFMKHVLRSLAPVTFLGTQVTFKEYTRKHVRPEGDRKWSLFIISL